METESSIAGLSMETLNQMAHEIKADCIVSITDQDGSSDIWVDIDMLKEGEIEEEPESGDGQFTVQVFKAEQEPVEYAFSKTKTRQFDGIVAEIVSDLIKRGHVSQNMKLLIVTDRTLAKKYNVSLLAFDVDRVLYRIGKFNLAENMMSETVIENTIEIAREIGAEGREGKKVGTLFIIGNQEELKPYCKQLIMNPFFGYDKELLNIVHNDNIKETIKNFAQLDGAFILDNEGNIHSAGTYIDVDTSDIKPYQGWGTKHLAATAITKTTGSVAVLVSESGGMVKIFKNGKLILKMR